MTRTKWMRTSGIILAALFACVVAYCVYEKPWEDRFAVIQAGMSNADVEKLFHRVADTDAQIVNYPAFLKPWQVVIFDTPRPAPEILFGKGWNEGNFCICVGFDHDGKAVWKGKVPVRMPWYYRFREWVGWR